MRSSATAVHTSKSEALDATFSISETQRGLNPDGNSACLSHISLNLRSLVSKASSASIIRRAGSVRERE